MTREIWVYSPYDAPEGARVRQVRQMHQDNPDLLADLMADHPEAIYFERENITTTTYADETPVVEEPVLAPSTDQWIVVSGNPVDGFTFTGPFNEAQDAVEHGLDTDDNWWIAPLHPVVQPEETRYARIADHIRDYGSDPT